MNKRPISLKVVALFYLIVSVGLPLQIAWLYEHNLLEWHSIFIKMTTLNWIVFGLGLATSLIVWNGHKLVKFVLPVNMLLVAINNWAVSAYGSDYNETMTLGATLAFTVFNSVLLFGRGLDAILYPELQWWRVSERIECHQNVRLATPNGNVIEAKIFDISKTGVFLERGDAFSASELKAGESVTLSLELPQESEPLIIAAKIVREAPARGHYPSGFGLCFESLSLFKRLSLAKYLRSTGLATVS